MITKEEAKEELKKLIEGYNKNKDNKDFADNEAQVCSNLILPFFEKVLGWTTKYPEFIPQATKSGKRMDYLVKLDGINSFVIEAKALNQDILDNTTYYKQALGYAHSKGILFSILTNFRYFIILNSFFKLEPLKAVIGRPIDITKITDEDFDLIWNFSKDIWKEKGEKNEELKSKIGYERRKKIDEQLLEDMGNWRSNILTNLKKHPRINKYDLTNEKIKGEVEEEIQRYIDRLIFVCYCEDKELTNKELRSLIDDKQGKYWNTQHYLLEEIRKIFGEYWKTYNSDLFKEGECDKFHIEDGIILKVLKDLRQPKEGLPYDFEIIDVDILGKTYENFIGHVIRGEKRFKEKKSKGKRRGEGIYYTPDYIVEYIVNNTLRTYIKNKSFKEIKKVKLLDPACGSGSFLLKAFDVLVEESQIRLNKELTYEEKEELLLNCIYGVDKDERACDIAKLNLSLKLAKKDKKLPELHNNIRNGDSLVDEKEIAGYKAFNWNNQFSFKFDIIIGNPPWVSLKGKHKSQDISEKELKYFFDKYNCDTYMPNLFEIFMWRCFTLVKENGYFSFIVPDRLSANRQFINIRKHILDNFSIEKLWFKVPFPEIIADTLVYVLKKEINKNNPITVSEYSKEKTSIIPQRLYYENEDKNFYYVEEKILKIFGGILKNKDTKKLSEVILTTSGCGAKSSLMTKKKIKKDQIKVMKGENIGRFDNRGFYWFEFKDKNLSGRTRNINKLGKKYKVLLRKTGIDLIATFDDSGIFPEQSLYFLYAQNDNNINTLLFLLGILNSNLMNCYYRNFAITNRDATPQLKNMDLDRFPIIIPKDTEPLIKIVKELLKLNLDLGKVPNINGTYKKIKKEIEFLEQKLNEEVYEIYGVKKYKEIIEKSLA